MRSGGLLRRRGPKWTEVRSSVPMRPAFSAGLAKNCPFFYHRVFYSTSVSSYCVFYILSKVGNPIYIIFTLKWFLSVTTCIIGAKRICKVQESTQYVCISPAGFFMSDSAVLFEKKKGSKSRVFVKEDKPKEFFPSGGGGGGGEFYTRRYVWRCLNHS